MKVFMAADRDGGLEFILNIALLEGSSEGWKRDDVRLAEKSLTHDC
jgi:hypothetical protein